MRIAYVANYQGPTLVARRPIVRNLSMSNRVKMELIATLLKGRSHDVVVISPGEPGEPRFRFYRPFSRALSASTRRFLSTTPRLCLSEPSPLRGQASARCDS